MMSGLELVAINMRLPTSSLKGVLDMADFSASVLGHMSLVRTVPAGNGRLPWLESSRTNFLRMLLMRV